MASNYLTTQKKYLKKAWTRPTSELSAIFKAAIRGASFHFQAFGESCRFSTDNIILNDRIDEGPRGLLIAMYASHAKPRKIEFMPLKSFKEFPGSMPYQGAFKATSEMALAPHVDVISSHMDAIIRRFSGQFNPDAPSGDFSFTLYPLPLLPLYYIFHLPDDEFPASVTCLFATNALDFMPLDGLADVAEYTAKKIISIIQ